MAGCMLNARCMHKAESMKEVKMIKMRMPVLAVLWILCLLFTVLPGESAFGSCGTEGGVVCGVGEPLTYRSAWSSENLNVSKAFERMEYLCVRALREWVWRWMVFKNETSLNQTVVEAINNVTMEARSRNITFMGMVQDFPLWMTGIETDIWDPQQVPHRNLTAGSPYMEFLRKYTWSWHVLAEAFPNITVWEVGNEYNLDQFLHPEGYPDQRFNLSTKVEITMDLLYFASNATHNVNPNLKIVLGGLGACDDLTEIGEFLDLLYEKIENTSYHPYTNSTDPNDFFQVASWHPYLSNRPPDQTWIEQNNQIHDVMIDHGDRNKSVVFSEFGYSDICTGLSQIQVAEYVDIAFALVDNFEPWLKMVFWFRLIDPDPCYDVWFAEKGQWREYGFGLVERPAENYALKPAAHAYRAICIPEFPSSLVLFSFTAITVVAVLLKKRRRIHKCW